MEKGEPLLGPVSHEHPRDVYSEVHAWFFERIRDVFKATLLLKAHQTHERHMISRQ